MLKITQPEGYETVQLAAENFLFLKLKKAEVYFDRAYIGEDVTLADVEKLFDVVPAVPTWSLAIRERVELLADAGVQVTVPKAEMEAPSADTQQWAEDEWVIIGDLRMYEGRYYRCLSPHKTQWNWNPGRMPTWWVEEPPPTGTNPETGEVAPVEYLEWVQGTYPIGTIRRYKGVLMIVIAGDGAGNNSWAPDVYGWGPCV